MALLDVSARRDGFVDPWTRDFRFEAGGGHTPALCSAYIFYVEAYGERAGAAAARAAGGDDAALAEYEDELREEFGPALERALAARRRMAGIWNTEHAMDDAAHRRGWIAFPEYFS